MYVKRRGVFVDVFTGYGWDNYSCFKIEKGKIVLVEGASVSDGDYKKLIQEVRNARS